MANSPKWVVKASRSLPLVETSSWDGPAAANRMLDAADIGEEDADYSQACLGFLVCDTANPDLRSGYKLPFADIIDGSLKADSSGINAAAQRLPQTDIPDSVRESAQGVIDHYKSKMKSFKNLPIRHAYSTFTIKAVDNSRRIFEGIATTPTPDRTGDIVEPLGAEFQLPIPLLWQHDSKQPIGWVTDADVSTKGIRIRGEVSNFNVAGHLKDRLDEAWQTIQAKLVGGLSIGFKALEESRINETFSYRIQKWLWLELSAVTIPANGEASITSIKSISEREMAALGRKTTNTIRLTSKDVPGVTGSSKPVTKGKDMKTVSEHIVALEATITAKQAQMQSVAQRSMEDGRSMDAAEKEEFDTLEQEVESIVEDLQRYRSLEKSAAFAAREVKDVRSVEQGSNVRASVQIKRERPAVKKGCEFAQFARCIAAGRGNLLQSYEIAKTYYGDNEELVSLVKNAVAAGNTVDPNWAGNLVPLYQRFTGDFVEFLRPQTIVGRFGVGGIPALRNIPFNVSIAGQTSGGQGYWVGEGLPKPLTRFDFNLTNLRWAKVANIAVITEELLRFSEPSADALVRDQLAAALIERLDLDFLDPNKAAGPVSPASLTYGVSTIASSGNSAADVRTDIAAAFNQYIAANITPTTAVWVLSARTALRLSLMRTALGNTEFPGVTMNGGMFENIPLITSEYQHSDSDGDNAVLINASDIWLADDGQVVVDASREASLQMNDVPTTQDATQGVGTSLVSMWQTNSVALKAERFINWQKRRPSAVVVINAVNWGLDSGT